MTLTLVTLNLALRDVSKINPSELPNFDILLAGFPCQPFSIAGHRQGFNDHQGRGNLFFDIARILKVTKPLGFLLENVKNLYNHNNGETYKTIIKVLTDLGYECKSKS